jgi:hypothetical protein
MCKPKPLILTFNRSSGGPCMERSYDLIYGDGLWETVVDVCDEKIKFIFECGGNIPILRIITDKVSYQLKAISAFCELIDVMFECGDLSQINNIGGGGVFEITE